MKQSETIMATVDNQVKYLMKELDVENEILTNEISAHEMIKEIESNIDMDVAISNMVEFISLATEFYKLVDTATISTKMSIYDFTMLYVLKVLLVAYVLNEPRKNKYVLQLYGKIDELYLLESDYFNLDFYYPKGGI